jgi:hypothetical protein
MYYNKEELINRFEMDNGHDYTVMPPPVGFTLS